MINAIQEHKLEATKAFNNYKAFNNPNRVVKSLIFMMLSYYSPLLSLFFT